MYRLILSSKVRKFLVKNDKIAKQFYHKVKILLSTPFSDSLDIKKLKWTKNKYRLRIWKYRFLYEISEEKIIIYFYDAGSRWDIY